MNDFDDLFSLHGVKIMLSVYHRFYIQGKLHRHKLIPWDL